jgi:hypothetical protein
MPKALAIDWIAAKAMYEEIGDSAKVAQSFGVSLSAIRQRAFREDWNKPLSKPKHRQASRETVRAVSRAVMNTVKTTLAQQVSDKVTRDVSRIVSKAVAQSEAIMDRGFDMSQRVRKPQEFRAAVEGWRIGHDGARRALGLDELGAAGSGPCVNVLVQGALAPVIEIEPAPGYQDSTHPPSGPS